MGMVSIGGKLERDSGSIRLCKVIAVEGTDEVYFFDALLRHLKIADAEVRDVGGKDQFKSKLPALVRMSGFSDVRFLAIIRDADSDADAAFDSVRNILRDQQLDPPGQMNQFSNSNPGIGIFIMPGNSDTGMLEDLCLKTVGEHPAMECVNAFIDCASGLNDPPKIAAKAKAQAFLAAMPKIANSVGVGAQKGYWNLDSDELDNLRSFMDILR
ncbi:hypothetical protein DRO03_05870 [Methanosarcinales archaeon]|nr:MAG: hypothetical protein DRO03_05870 [Methanosarcinales archaeon]